MVDKNSGKVGLIESGAFSKLCGLPKWKLVRYHNSGKFLADYVSTGGFRCYRPERADEARKLIWKPKLMDDGGRNVVIDCQDLDHDLAYVWGLVMADGSVMGDDKTVILEMKDRQIVDDVAEIVRGKIHSRKDREMWRVCIPRKYSKRLISLGAERSKSRGFDIPPMSEATFCCYLRGLFDGDGSVGFRYGKSLRVTITGNPRCMAYIQKTLFYHFGLYMAWGPFRGMGGSCGSLETNRKESVKKFYDIIYRFNGACLLRKKEKFSERM